MGTFPNPSYSLSVFVGVSGVGSNTSSNPSISKRDEEESDLFILRLKREVIHRARNFRWYGSAQPPYGSPRTSGQEESSAMLPLIPYRIMIREREMEPMKEMSRTRRDQIARDEKLQWDIKEITYFVSSYYLSQDFYERILGMKNVSSRTVTFNSM